MKVPTTHTEARSWLSRQLGVPAIPDWMWDDLEDRGLVRDALSWGGEQLRELLEEARRIRRLERAIAGKRGVGRTGGAAKRIQGLLRPEELERASVLSRQLGRIASRRERVAALRMDLFGGAVLAPAAALSFFRSPLPYLLSRADLGSMRDVEVGKGSKYGASCGPEGQPDWTETIELQFGAPSKRRRRTFKVKRSVVGERRLVLPDALMLEASPLPIRAGTIAAELEHLCSNLEIALPWSAPDALWFVLTAQAPWVSPIRVEPGPRRATTELDHMALVLYVEPWVSASTVARVLRAYQAVLLGQRNRPFGRRALALLDFVEEREGTKTKDTWQARARAWNARFRQWAVADFRHFRRDYLKAREAIFFPNITAGDVAVAHRRIVARSPSK